MASRPIKRRRISPSDTDIIPLRGKSKIVDGVSSNHTQQQLVASATNGSKSLTDEEHDTMGNEIDSDEDGERNDGTSDSESGPDLDILPAIPSPSGAQNSSRTPRMDLPLTLSISKLSVIRMQVDELLRQVTPAYGKKEAPAEDMLHRIKTVIENLPHQEALSIQEAEKRLLKSHKIAVPFPSPRPLLDAQYKLAFSKPSSINVIGSYVLKTASRVDGRLSIDLVVNMPTSLFSPKDYLNYRYFHKRAYYIACLVAGIRASSSLDIDLSFTCLGGNSLLPVILVQPLRTDTASSFFLSKCDIYVIPAMTEQFFPLSKTLPDRNCIRIKEHHEEGETTSTHASPFYNASIRADSSVTSYLKLLHQTANECAGFREACLLGRTWLRQRGYTSSVAKGGFGHFEWAVLIALLLRGGGLQGKPILLSSYDGYQIFKATIQFLAIKNLAKQPLVVGESSTSDKVISFEDNTGSDIDGFWKDHKAPVCFDQDRGINILFKMMPWSYIALRKEAQTAVRVFASLPDPFEPLFIFRVDQPLVQYDLVARICLTKESGILFDTITAQSHMQQLYNNLIHGLGNRVKTINIWPSTAQPWSINVSRPRRRNDDILIGVDLDVDNASRTVDRGPPADAIEAAAAFRSFWGDKAELRRFKDGQILECVAWDEADPLSIIKQILQYLLEKHAGKEQVASMIFIGNDFSSAPVAMQDLAVTNSASEAVLAGFRVLEKRIQSLESLPLQIRQIQCTRSGLLNTMVQANMHQGVAPTDVMIQFEGSGRWPDDLAAISMTKIAFLLKMDELLMEKAGNTTTKLGLENEHNEFLNRSFLDVIYPGSLAFRLRIHHEREQTLIERRLADKSLIQKQREEAALALAEYRRIFVQKPRHAQGMQTLVTRFRALTPTILALSAWFNGHLLGNHFPNELIEIIVAHVFLQPYPWQVPSSAMTGLLRTLHFLAHWEWQTQPLIVDFSGSMKKAETQTIQTRFEAWRKIDPSLNRVVMFVATNYDTDGTTWTEYHPAKVVAGRMTSLAKAACQAVREQGVDLDIGSLFISPMKDFDFVIHIHPRFSAARGYGKTQTKYKNLQVSSSSDDMTGYRPVEMYAAELQRLYGDSFVLFCDWNSRALIAGLWSPHTSPRKWKINLPYSSMLVQDSEAREEGEGEGEVEATINKPAILSEMARLGGDMVTKVESNI